MIIQRDLSICISSLVSYHATDPIPGFTSEELLTERPVISICIPTFNRCNCLRKLMEKLVQLKNMHGPKLEICISNNHSTDDTAIVI